MSVSSLSPTDWASAVQSFSSEELATLRLAVLPHLQSAYASDTERLAAAIEGLNGLADIVLEAVGLGYLEMREGLRRPEATAPREAGERDDARLELRRLKLALDWMSDGAQIIDRDWRYLYVNEVAAKQARHSKEALLGHTMLEMHPGFEQTPVFATIRRAMERQVAEHTETLFPFPDGTTGWFEISVQPIADGIFILSMDISERKRAEEAVRAKNLELEAANKELEAFSYSVSHDLRAPLRAVIGFSAAALEDYGAQLGPEGQRQLAVIQSEAKNMGTLVDDLLAFSRLGRQQMRRAEIDMAALAREVEAEQARQWPERRVPVRIGALAPARGDRSMLRQTWVNLLANAYKFTRSRPNAEIEIGSSATETETVYWVRDNGVGFDMRYVDKLFGVFQRLHAVDEFEGTGIGLSIVKRVITRHGGRVWAEGQVDAGATFYFALPLQEAEHERN